jgi:two-component system NtrC family sensor kinase
MTEQDKETAASNSQENNSEENNSEERVRALVADYEARLDEVAELVARVRHEINNPLAAVLGQAQLLLREELSEKARKRAQTIEGLAIRLRDIVAQLRQIQKPLRSSGNDENGSV